MKFSIITPTFRKKDLLKRAVDSLLAQTYKNWEMIIVNDSPYDKAYTEFAISINDQRIRYHCNTAHRGENYSKNVALERVSADSTWVIFLNDSDYLSPDTLMNFYQNIMISPKQKWIVSNQTLNNRTPLHHFPRDGFCYSYIWHYLILKRYKGLVTHCIETKLIHQTHAHFPHHLKQGESWFFFYQLGLHTDTYYCDHTGTVSDNNYYERARLQPSKALVVIYEGLPLKLYKHPTFLLYILLRLLGL